MHDLERQAEWHSSFGAKPKANSAAGQSKSIEF
jgi:hypothetical protein